MWPFVIASLVSSGLNYLGSRQQEPSQPAPPPNYFGADGSMQVWNPAANGYWTIGARTPSDQLSTDWNARLMQNKLMGGGGYGQTVSDLQNEIRNLQGRMFNGMPGQAYSEIRQRIADLQNTLSGMHDIKLDYSPIGISSDTDLLRYRGQTDTVNKYLTDTLDTGYKDAMATAAQANAARGMGQSTMADWGREQMASNYAKDKTGVAMQSENFMRALKQADEASKLSIYNAANSGLGLNASIAQGQQSAANAQASLAQQMASYNQQLQTGWQNAHDQWATQNANRPWASLASGVATGVRGWAAQQEGKNPWLAMLGNAVKK